jgi:hydrogenase-4 component B
VAKTLGTYTFAALFVIGFVAAFVALLTGKRERLSISLSFGLVAVASLLGIVTALDVFISGTLSFQLTLVPYLGSFSVQLDQLSAFFLLTICVLTFSVALFSNGYVREYIGKYHVGLFGALFAMFFISMVLVVSASNVVLFLIAWEMMSLCSYFLVVYESKEREAVSAGLLYLVMTHIGTALIMVSMITLSFEAGTFDFNGITASQGAMPVLLRNLAFVFALLGFGMKAGIVPLHVWLPHAHPAAPSNVSALMSGVMIKTAIYMLIRTSFLFLGVTEVWWGLLVLLIGSVTALLGVLYALMEKDIKRALAYSTVENVGIIFIALGASMVFYAYGLAELSALALIAALLQVLNHSLFKGLLFMGAGSIVYATGTKDMERLGGLAKRMRLTSVFFFVGALSISAIPPFNGFVSEWLIFQSLLLSSSINDVTVNLILAIALGMLALTGALAAACFVRIFGISFLARPRSREAAEAREVPRSMLLGMAIPALLCVLTGILAFMIVPFVNTITTGIVGVSIADQLVNGLFLQIPSGSDTSMSPLLIAVLLGLFLAMVFLSAKYYGGRAKRTRSDTWDCGTPLTERNEYTATGFSQPMNRVFQVLYRSKQAFRSEPSSDPYVRKEMTYRTSVEQIFEKYLYAPLAHLATGVARRVSVIQTGSIQAYLAYIFAILVLLLLIFR